MGHSVVRDCVAYSLSIITMAVCALTPITSDLPELNGKSGFSFWEAMFMTLMYVGYIVMMSQNKKVMAMIGAPPPGFEEEEEEEEEVEPEPETAENPLEAAKEKASAMKASISAKMNKGDGDEENASDEGAKEKKDEEEEEGGVFSIISMPFSLLFSATIPACDDDDWEVGQEGGAVAPAGDAVGRRVVELRDELLDVGGGREGARPRLGDAAELAVRLVEAAAVQVQRELGCDA